MATAALLVAWTVVIAVGAGRAADADTWLNLPSFGWVAYVLLGLMALVIIAVLVAAVVFREEGKQRPQAKRRSIWPLLILLVVFLALSQREPSEVEPALQEDPIPTETEAEPNDGRSISVAPPGRGETAALIAIAVAAAALLLWARRGAEEPAPIDDVPLDEALTPAIQQAAQQLALGDDPRSSVLLAYDGLEAVLETRGLPRGRSETPTEHMRRVLASATGASNELDPEPLLRLAGLYEVARFSDRPITSAEQATAADSLRRVEARMRAL